MSSINDRAISLEQAAREQRIIHDLLARRRELREKLRTPVHRAVNRDARLAAAAEPGAYLNSYQTALPSGNSGAYLAANPPSTPLAGSAPGIAPWMRGPATASHLRNTRADNGSGNIWTAQVTSPRTHRSAPLRETAQLPHQLSVSAGGATGNYLARESNPVIQPPLSPEETGALGEDLARIDEQLKAHVRAIVGIQKALSAPPA